MVHIVSAKQMYTEHLPLNSILLHEDRCGEPGSGKLGMGRDLNYRFGISIGSLVRSMAPLRSVFKLKAFGCVILGGADLRSRC